MRTHVSLLSIALAGAALAGCDAPRPTLVRVSGSDLCVTSGEINAVDAVRLSIDNPSVRAVAPGFGSTIAELHFRYLGPTPQTRPLASGMIKRQIGLKLRASDTCNLVYAMWQIAPDPGIDVLVKRNPGQHTHRECGARGYTRVKPRRLVPAPGADQGDWHKLRVKLQDDALTIHVDGVVAWEGILEPSTRSLSGPVGLRTDNGRFDFSLYASADRDRTISTAAACDAVTAAK